MKGVYGSIVAILNTGARAGAGDAAHRITAAFANAGAAARVVTCASGELQRAARDALDGGASTVVAGGGDGTVNAVASVLAGTGVPLGVLPLGTLNHFARDLGIPAGPQAAAAAIVNGRAVPVDVCEVNGRVFVNNSSLGLYPIIVEQREYRQSLGHGKLPAFVWAAFAALRWYPFLTLRLIAAGKELTRRTPLAFIGNNAYELQGLHIGRRASLSQGRMCVYVAHRTGRLGLMRLALSAFAGRLRTRGNFDEMYTGELWIDSPRRRLRVALDGEVETMPTPLHYRIRPGALRVMVP